LTQVLPKRPDDPQLHTTLGDLYRTTKQPALATAEFREAARLAPNDPAVHFQLGLAYADAGETDRAIEAFRKTVALRPADADAYYNLGLVVGDKIRALLDERVAAYQKAVEFRPTLADAHYNLGVALIQKAQIQINRTEEKHALLQLALEQFRLFQQFAPSDPKAASAAHNIEILEPQVK
jgi:tetratricopeptide (TPR) repeat protein